MVGRVRGGERLRHAGQAHTKMKVEELKRIARKIIVEMKSKRKPILPGFSPEDVCG